MDENKDYQIEPEYTQDEKLAIKYRFIRNKIFLHYSRGCKYLKIAKFVVAILFVLYTVMCCIVGGKSGNIMGWLIQWVILIFLNVFAFLVADYAKYLIDDKIIPYLENDDELDYGEYDIFVDHDELETDEDEEEDD